MSQRPASPQPQLLAAWSVTTTWQEKHAYRQSKEYRDTPRSRWEAARVASVRTARRR
jgi:hypothetical protein